MALQVVNSLTLAPSTGKKLPRNELQLDSTGPNVGYSPSARYLDREMPESLRKKLEAGHRAQDEKDGQYESEFHHTGERISTKISLGDRDNLAGPSVSSSAAGVGADQRPAHGDKNAQEKVSSIENTADYSTSPRIYSSLRARSRSGSVESQQQTAVPQQGKYGSGAASAASATIPATQSNLHQTQPPPTQAGAAQEAPYNGEEDDELASILTPQTCDRSSYLYQYATLKFTPRRKAEQGLVEGAPLLDIFVLDVLDEAHILPPRDS